MKLFLAAMMLAGSAMAAPISCAHPRSTYAIWVSNDHRTAELTVSGKRVQFGSLTCRTTKQFACHSPHVADAGYGTVFTRQPSGKLTVRIEEMWIGGTRLLGHLPCVEAMN